VRAKLRTRRETPARAEVCRNLRVGSAVGPGTGTERRSPAVEHLIVVATTLAIATFVTGLLLPVLARRTDQPEALEAALAEELAALR
jgi:hypothetical protein